MIASSSHCLCPSLANNKHTWPAPINYYTDGGKTSSDNGLRQSVCKANVCLPLANELLSESENEYIRKKTRKPCALNDHLVSPWREEGKYTPKPPSFLTVYLHQGPPLHTHTQLD